MKRANQMRMLGALLMLSSCIFLYAQASSIPGAKLADILFKVMSYDRTVLGREDAQLRVGIVYTESSASSMSGFEQIMDSLFELVKAGRTVGGKKVTCSGISYTSESALADMVRMLKVTVLFVTPGNDGNLSAIDRVAKSSGVLTFSGVTEYISKGVAAGVEMVDGNPKVVVDMASAKAQGANFKAELLTVARVIQ
jgi:hypothetical protein